MRIPSRFYNDCMLHNLLINKNIRSNNEYTDCTLLVGMLITVRERNGHQASYSEAKKMKSLALHTHDFLLFPSSSSSSSSSSFSSSSSCSSAFALMISLFF